MAMATRWSSEFIVAEHRDLQASAMAIDWTGIYVLLAGRRYLAIKKLDDSSDTLYKVPRHSKYEVGAAEWNPSSANKELCAIASNQRVEILSWVPGGELVQTQTFRSHTRVVTDLNWHRFDPNLLASCSIDTFIHIWDLRDPRRPAVSLSAIAGASQVRWNRLSRYLLATAHDGDIKLWDQRKGTAPVQYIAAHLSKIHGLDWSPTHENRLATSSQDCTVKFFDITNPRRAESILPTTSPVWRARYTPFGEGLVTVVVPQIRRGENSLLLWNIANHSAPVYTFVGHTDVVLEFEWRKHREDSPDYQLVTWSRDQSLRIWTIEPFLQKLCGHEDEVIVPIEDSEEPPEISIDRSSLGVDATLTHPLQQISIENGSGISDVFTSLTFEESDEPTMATSLSPPDRDIVPSPTQPKTLQQEFSLININIPNVQLDAMDALRRCCTATASRNGHIVVLHVSFPPSYPFNAPPLFQFGQGTSVDNAAVTKILKVLKHTAQQRVRTNKSCLEPCLRQLVTALDQIASEESESKVKLRTTSGSYFEPANIYGSNFQDAYVPFPRTSGAKFCSVGLLVCFGRPPFARHLPSRDVCPTPRSLSALAGNFNGFTTPGVAQYSLVYPPGTQAPTTDAGMTIKPLYFQERKASRRSSARSIQSGRSTHSSSKQSSKTSKSSSPKAVITIYDASSLFSIHKELGEKYVFDCHDLPGMCHRNAAASASVGRRDLVQTWTLAALAATPPTTGDQEDDVPWPLHPFGRAMIESLISFYARQSDIQTAAMLSCTFGCRTENQDIYKLKQLSKAVNVSRLATGKWWLKPGGSPYHTVHKVDSSSEGWNYPMLKQNRSNSWSDSLDFNPPIEHREVQDTDQEKSLNKYNATMHNYRMLDDKNIHLYDVYRQEYAEILHRWHLLDARAQVLKYMSTAPEPHKGVEFFTECQHCNKQVRGASCLFCKRLILQCAICHISVRGSSNFCLVCGHGGHTNHMMYWFETESVCPTGCGCNCLTENANVLSP